MKSAADIVSGALAAATAVPGFNIPYLPMMRPVVAALRDTGTFGFIQVARLEWEKFQARSLKAIRDEYEAAKDQRFTRLHLDHVPVIDEDNRRVDWRAIIAEAIALGYQSVMVDGSRLPLAENIAVTREAAEMAHAAGVPVEAELGAVLGHEAGPLPPYDELFASGKGFTDPDDAARFVRASGADWLSVAIGNVHGAIGLAQKDKKKVEARLNIEHLKRIRRAAGVPLVLHGGSGIRREDVLAAIKEGIAKINVGTAIRQPYEVASKQSAKAAEEAAYRAAVDVITNELEVAGSAARINP
jgi:ketose-bisphosphate aldolase